MRTNISFSSCIPCLAVRVCERTSRDVRSLARLGFHALVMHVGPPTTAFNTSSHLACLSTVCSLIIHHHCRSNARAGRSNATGRTWPVDPRQTYVNILTSRRASLTPCSQDGWHDGRVRRPDHRLHFRCASSQNPLELKLTTIGFTNIVRFGPGPNGMLRTLGQYMVGSAATFG